MYLAAFCIELLGLYVISRHLTETVYMFLYTVFRNRTVSVTIITILLFPGTVLHELAHLFTAGILGVPAGKLELAPESIRTERIQMGSVSIAHTDPVRRYLIGFAPVIWGTLVLSALSFLFTPRFLEFWQFLSTGGTPNNQNTLILSIIFYLMITVSSTMFSSPEDLKGLLPFIIAIGFVAAVIFFLGIRINLNLGIFSGPANKAIEMFISSVGIVLTTDFFLVAIISVVNYLLQKLLGVRFQKV